MNRSHPPFLCGTRQGTRPILEKLVAIVADDSQSSRKHARRDASDNLDGVSVSRGSILSGQSGDSTITGDSWGNSQEKGSYATIDPVTDPESDAAPTTPKIERKRKKKTRSLSRLCKVTSKDKYSKESKSADVSCSSCCQHICFLHVKLPTKLYYYY